MDEESFLSYLRKGGRSETAAIRCVNSVRTFYKFINEETECSSLSDVSSDEIDIFVSWADNQAKPKTKTYLWGLIYYFDYASENELKEYASYLRKHRIVRKPFRLADFRGVSPEYTGKLASIGIVTVNDMLESGAMKEQRRNLTQGTDIPEDAILDFVMLSDLARIPGVKGIRARLYVDAGVDSVEKLAASDPKELRTELLEFVKRTKFDGIAPLPAELNYSIGKARKLSKVVEY
jgi:hypothetical protein